MGPPGLESEFLDLLDVYHFCSRCHLYVGGSERVTEDLHPSHCLFGAPAAAGYLPVLSSD